MDAIRALLTTGLTLSLFLPLIEEARGTTKRNHFLNSLFSGLLSSLLYPLRADMNNEREEAQREGEDDDQPSQSLLPRLPNWPPEDEKVAKKSLTAVIDAMASSPLTGLYPSLFLPFFISFFLILSAGCRYPPPNPSILCGIFLIVLTNLIRPLLLVVVLFSFFLISAVVSLFVRESLRVRIISFASSSLRSTSPPSFSPPSPSSPSPFPPPFLIFFDVDVTGIFTASSIFL